MTPPIACSSHLDTRFHKYGNVFPDKPGALELEGRSELSRG